MYIHDMLTIKLVQVGAHMITCAISLSFHLLAKYVPWISLIDLDVIYHHMIPDLPPGLVNEQKTRENNSG